MLRKEAPKVFGNLTPDQIISFKTVFEVLTCATILYLPKVDQQYSMHTDALDYQIGCVLFQTNEKKIRCPFGNFSQHFKWPNGII